MLITLCVGITPVYGVEVTLSWDASATPIAELTGYKVHCGEVSGVYTMEFNVAPTETTATIDCAPIVNPYYVVSATSISGGTSGYSNEVQCAVTPTGLRCGQ